ncbi:MAG: TSUP family transporter, partial [Rubrimonas sp.]
MVVAPLVALIAPQAMPAGVLLIGFAVTLLSTPRPLGAVAPSELIPAVIGRAAGAFAAAGVVALAPDPGSVAVLVALSVLVGVALSLSGLRLSITTPNLIGAGALSGLTGTLTSVGAPPLALLYQHAPAAHARATLNAFFSIGIALSLLALAAQGQVRLSDAAFALSMVPAAACGFLLARPVMRRLGGRSVRPIILGLATLASGMILLRWLVL